MFTDLQVNSDPNAVGSRIPMGEDKYRDTVVLGIWRRSYRHRRLVCQIVGILCTGLGQAHSISPVVDLCQDHFPHKVSINVIAGAAYQAGEADSSFCEEFFDPIL